MDINISTEAFNHIIGFCSLVVIAFTVVMVAKIMKGSK